MVMMDQREGSAAVCHWT